MAEHVFDRAVEGMCLRCGVRARDAHRVVCKAASKPKALKSHR